MARWDMVLLNHQLSLTRQPRPDKKKVVCTVEMAEGQGHTRGRTKLTALAEYFKINVDQNRIHRALYDAEVTAKIYYELAQIKKLNEDKDS